MKFLLNQHFTPHAQDVNCGTRRYPSKYYYFMQAKSNFQFFMLNNLILKKLSIKEMKDQRRLNLDTLFLKKK